MRVRLRLLLLGTLLLGLLATAPLTRSSAMWGRLAASASATARLRAPRALAPAAPAPGTDPTGDPSTTTSLSPTVGTGTPSLSTATTPTTSASASVPASTPTSTSGATATVPGIFASLVPALPTSTDTPATATVPGAFASLVPGLPTDTPSSTSVSTAMPTAVASTSPTSPVSSTVPPSVTAQLATLPLSFEQNMGQTDSSVAYLAHGAGYTLFLTGDEAVLALVKPPTYPFDPKAPLAPGAGPGNSVPLTATDPLTVSVVHMRFPGASFTSPVTSPIIAQDELPGKVNYFIGKDPTQWQTDIPTYARVTYTGIYPGIDLTYYGHAGALEYDWTVAPGADPHAIALALDGVQGLHLDQQGNLAAQTASGPLLQHVPLGYQEIDGQRRPVSVRWTLRGGGQAGFEVGSYDASKPLVIDPILGYSTYLGGAGGDSTGYGIAVDGTGDAYVVGRTNSSSFPTQSAYSTTLSTPNDAFVAKLSADGRSLLYSTYLGGNNDDQGYGIALNSIGNAYVTGMTWSSDFPTTAGAYQKQPGGGNDIFVTELSASGNSLVYSTYLGGGSYDVGEAIAVDGSGNAYVAGENSCGNCFGQTGIFPTTTGAYQTGFGGGGQDAIMAKLSADGRSLLYSTYLGGSGDEQANGIAVDGMGTAYITGWTTAQMYAASSNVYQPNYGGGAHDAFVAKLNPALSGSASLLYVTYLGSSGDDQANAIAIDAAGNAYVTGLSSPVSPTQGVFPTKPNAYQSTPGGGKDAFVSKLSADGSNLLYSTLLGGNADEQGNGLAVDSAGAAYVTGYTYSGNYPLSHAFQSTPAGGYVDAFVSAVDTVGGGLRYSSYLGGSAGDWGDALTLDSAGSVYVTGNTASSDFPVTGAYSSTFVGNASSGYGEAFITKIASTPVVTATIDDSWQGGALHQFTYVGSGWIRCTTPPSGANCAASYYNTTNSADNVANDYATLQFYGAGVTYYGTKDANRGIAAISVDGGPETMIDLYAPTQQGNLPLYTSPPLGNGFHTLKVRVTGTKDGSSAGTYVTVDRADVLQATSDLGFSPYRQQITVTNTSGITLSGSTMLPVPSTSTDYVVQLHLTGAQAAYVYNNASDKTTFSDVTLWYTGGSAPQQLDIDYDTALYGAWSATNVTLWFKLQAPIAPGAADGHYVLAWGNPNAVAKRVWANIYPLQDGFNGSLLDTNKWTAVGTVAVANGAVTVTDTGTGTRNDMGLISKATYGPSYAVSMRTQLGPLAPAQYNTPGFQNKFTVGGGTPFYDPASVGSLNGNNWVGYYAGDGGAGAGSTAYGSLDTGYRIYTVARDTSGTPYFWRDADIPAKISSAASTTAVNAGIHTTNFTSGTFTNVTDWIKVRPWVPTEPTVTAGTMLASPCPSGWSCGDIGYPLLAGGQYTSGGSYTLQGAGADIGTGGYTDQFQYLWQSVAGDSSVSARVTAQANTSAQAKTGLMYRASSDAAAAYYAVVLTPQYGNGSYFLQAQYRTPGGTGTYLAGRWVSLPIYLRLTRVGNTFTAYSSPDGMVWSPIANSTMTVSGMPSAALAGLAVTSNNTSVLGAATFDRISGTISTVAGTGTAGYGGDSGPATSAWLNTPSGVAIDSAGNLYIADTLNNRVREVLAGTGVITTVAGTGSAGYSGDGSAATAARLNSPLSVAVDAVGNLYIADTNNHRIRKVLASTHTITTVAGTGTAGYSGDGGAATGAELNSPHSVVVDTADNLYIADTSNNRVREVLAGTGVITTVAGTGSAGYSGDGGAATAAQLNSPYSVGVDTSGNVYIADTNNNRVRKVAASSGVITTVAGTGTAGYSGDGGTGTAAQLNMPIGVAVDSVGTLYIGDAYNQRVRKVAASSGVITTVAGTGTAGYSGDGGVATAAQLNYPRRLGMDTGGNLYIVDQSNHRIRKVQSAGLSMTLCPQSWSCTDIGSPVLPGGQALSPNGIYTVQGAGSDIWGTSDQFHYVYQSLAGDGSITTRLSAEANTDSWAKAGVMIRQSTAADAPYYFAMVTPGNGIDVQDRATPGSQGGNAQWPLQVAGGTPTYLRVTRQGSSFTAATSSDGVTWTSVGTTTTIAMPSTALFGLAVTSHNGDAMGSATFDHALAVVTPATLTLSTYSGVAGSSVTLTLAHFSLDSTSWTGHFDGGTMPAPPGSGTNGTCAGSMTSGTGSASTVCSIPWNASPGTHQICADGNNGPQGVCAAPFTVLAPTPTPTNTPTATPTPTNTPTATPTNTPTPTSTPTSAAVTIPSGYSSAMRVDVETGSSALTGSTGSGAGYTIQVVLDGSTTPSAATVYAAIKKWDATMPDGSALDATNFPNGYPDDLTAWYGGTQIDDDVREATSSLIIVDLKLQATLAANTWDTSNYLLAWGNSAPTLKNTLPNIYLWGDNFAGSSLNGAYNTAGVTATVSNGSVQFLPVPGSNAGPAAGISIGAGNLNVTNDYDVQADVAVDTAESNWTQDATRAGIGVRANGSSMSGYGWMIHGTGSNSPQAFLDDAVAWSGAFGSSVPANTWESQRYEIIGASPGTQQAKIWSAGTTEPTAWLNNPETGFNGSYIGNDVRLTGVTTAHPYDNITITYRYFRVRWAVSNPPTVVSGGYGLAPTATPTNTPDATQTAAAQATGTAAVQATQTAAMQATQTTVAQTASAATATAAAQQTQTAAAQQTQTAAAQQTQTAAAQPTNTPILPTTTPVPTIAGTRVPVDDSVQGQGPNQFSYVGLGWQHCQATCPVLLGGVAGTAVPDYYNGSYSADNTANDYLTVVFTGTGVELYGAVTLQGGTGAAAIDGKRDDGSAGTDPVYFYPGAPSPNGGVQTVGGNQLVYRTAHALPNTLHVFTLRVTKTNNTSSLDYYVYPDRIDLVVLPSGAGGSGGTGGMGARVAGQSGAIVGTGTAGHRGAHARRPGQARQTGQTRQTKRASRSHVPSHGQTGGTRPRTRPQTAPKQTHNYHKTTRARAHNSLSGRTGGHHYAPPGAA